MGIWAVKFQQLGQRALIVGQAGGSPLRGTIIEYRHDKYSCPSPFSNCDFADVSIANFGGAPYNADSSTNLNDAAFRPYCDGGVIVGGKSNYQGSSGKIIEFRIIGGTSCRASSGGN